MCHRLRCVALVALSCATSARPQVCTPHLLGMDRRGPAEAIARSGDLIHLGAGAALHVFDVTTPGAPVELGWANLDRLALDVAAWGNKVVVRDAKGIDFLDVSDRSHPFVAASLEVGPSSEPFTVTTMNDHAWYVADQALHAVEITDPAHPVEIGAYPVALARDVA